MISELEPCTTCGLKPWRTDVVQRRHETYWLVECACGPREVWIASDAPNAPAEKPEKRARRVNTFDELVRHYGVDARTGERP